MSYRGCKRRKSDTYTLTHTHTQTSGRQLKITFVDVLDYSEYSDTNNSKKKKKFDENIASSVRNQKRDDPRQGVAQGRVPSPTKYYLKKKQK